MFVENLHILFSITGVFIDVQVIPVNCLSVCVQKNQWHFWILTKILFIYIFILVSHYCLSKFAFALHNKYMLKIKKNRFQYLCAISS